MKTLIYSLALSLGLFSLAAEKVEPLEKTVKLSYNLNLNAQIDIDASNTEMIVEIWDQPKVEIEVAFLFRGRNHRDKIETFLKDFEQHVKNGIDASASSMRIETYRTMPKKMNIGWEDFSILEYTFSRDELRLQYKIKMPAQGAVNIRHSYRDLRIDGTVLNLNLEQYSGRFAAKQINSGKLSMKYGEATIDRFLKGNIYLYENDLAGKQFGEVELNAKYSQVQINELDQAKLTAYESEFRFQKVVALEGNLKYSELSCMQMQSLTISTYESEYRIESLKSVNLSSSKYSKYEFGQVQSIKIGQAYEDKMKVSKVQSFDAGNSKYCKHLIVELQLDYSLQGYECDLRIEKLNGPSGNIKIKGKYVKAEINTEAAVFELQASLQYGKVDFSESQVDVVNVSKNSNNTMANIKSKNHQAGKGFSILVNGYETDVTLY